MIQGFRGDAWRYLAVFVRSVSMRGVTHSTMSQIIRGIDPSAIPPTLTTTISVLEREMIFHLPVSIKAYLCLSVYNLPKVGDPFTTITVFYL